MRKRLQVLRPWMLTGLVACMMGGWSVTARGEEPKTNVCGCYQNTAGECICTRKGKCDCPGECEPKGCDEKRQKALEKEVKEETRKAEAAEKKRQEEAAEKQRKAEEQAAEMQRKAEEQVTEDGDSETVNGTSGQKKAAESSEERSIDGKAKEKGKGKKKGKDEKSHSRAGEDDDVRRRIDWAYSSLGSPSASPRPTPACT